MSIDLLERGASALGPLLNEVMFVGGATVSLWITDPGAPAPRPTKDVDVVVDVVTRLELHDFEARLRDLGFSEDRDSGVICRWRRAAEDHERDDDLILDAMPADAKLIGFENTWQRESLPHAVQRALPSGTVIRAIPPAHLVATKLEAFRGRGAGDYLGSHDLEDVVLLVDGRAELVSEVRAAPEDLRVYLADQVSALLDAPRFTDSVFGFLRPDFASQARAEAVVFPRLRELAEIGQGRKGL